MESSGVQKLSDFLNTEPGKNRFSPDFRRVPAEINIMRQY